MFAFSDDLQPPNIKLATGNVTDFSENLSAAYDAIQLTGMHDAKQMAITRFLDPFVQETNDLGANIKNPGDFYSQLTGRQLPRSRGTMKLPAGSIEDGYEEEQKTPFLVFHERLATMNKARAKNNLRELTAEEVFKGAEKLALDAKTKSQYISAHQSTAGWWGEMVGGLGAGAESILTSPAAPMMFIGAPWRMTGSVISQVARHALYDGIAGASLEAMAQPDVKKWWDSLGLKYDSRTFWHHVVVAGGGSAVFGGALRGTIIGVPAAARGVDAAQVKMRGKQFEISREYLRNIDAKELKAFEQAIENLSPDQIREGVRAFQKAGINISPEGQMAFRIMNHDDENPVAGSTVSSQTEHLDRGAQATHALETGLPPNMPERPQNGTVVPDSIHHFDNLDGEVFRFKPEEIEVDAKLFQFKSGAGPDGVVKTGEQHLMNVTEWDADLAGTVHVYEFADGRIFIADGHQRLGLAKRLKAKDPNLDIRIYARKWREVDGVSPEMAMAKAATANITMGTGSLVDAVKVLRMNPDQLRRLQRSTPFIRDAKNLAKVKNDEAFGMVVNEIVDAKIGSLVGKFVEDPAKQLAIMKLLAKAEPENLTQAEAIIRQANEMEFTETTQSTLFGDETILQSLFKERAKVLDATIKIIRRDRTVFNSLVENQKRIEAEGNKLASDTNLERVSTDGQALQILQTQANRKGPLSEALNAAAAQYQKDGKLNAAASQFVESVRRGSERGDYTGNSRGYEGRRFDPAEETDQVNAAIDLAEFDPSGAGATRQADALESSVKEEINKVVEAPQPDIKLREDLRQIVEDGAKPAEIEAHPAIIDAIEKAKAIQETHLKSNYLSDDWKAERQFIFSDETVTGYDLGVQRLYENARRLAWESDGVAFPGTIAQERRVTIVLGPPASGKSLFANRIAQKNRAVIIDSDEAKKVLPEYGGGIGANAVHEESAVISNLMKQKAIENGDNIVIPALGSKIESTEMTITAFKNMGYDVDLVFMKVSSDIAYNRMIGRFIDEGRLIPPEFMHSIANKPESTYISLRGKANRYAQIDNEGPKEGPHPITNASKENPLDGVELRLRPSGDESIPRLPKVERTEQTPQGTQTLIEGVEPITPATLAQQGMDDPLMGVRTSARPRYEVESKPMDEGLFDLGLRDQGDLLDLAIPVGQQLDEAGELVARTQTVKEILDEIDQDKAMLKRLEECV